MLCIFSFWNVVNFGIIIYLLIIDGEKEGKEESKLLSLKKLRRFLFYELIVFLKVYLHIISYFRNGQYRNVSRTTNNDSCWNEINIIEDNKENYENEKRLREIKKQNMNLILENQRLKEEKIKYDNTMLRNKKIEIITKYIKSKYNINISKDLLYKKLLSEIKNKCGLIIDSKKYEEIIINYTEQNIFNYLICPLSHEIFKNPYITPEGQTFDKNEIMKEIKKTGLNPITNKQLKPEELVENKLIADICEIVNLYKDEFNIKHFNEIKQKLIANETNKLFDNPYVISKGDNKGNTVEKKPLDNLTQYPNLVIKNIIQHYGKFVKWKYKFPASI